jgi:hypothetical protein
MNRQPRFLLGLTCLVICFAASLQAQTEDTVRLYEGMTTLVNNPRGKDFDITLDVRDINHLTPGPAEILIKVYDPQGHVVVREVLPDDGVTKNAYTSPMASWDHEAWYYATCYSRGLRPTVRWSTFSDPGRLKMMVKRTFNYTIKGTGKGVYRIVLLGTPDHYIDLETSPNLASGRIGSLDWLHGHGDMYRKSYLYVPRGAELVKVLFFQLDQPTDRAFVLRDHKGKIVDLKEYKDAPLVQGKVTDGLVTGTYKFEESGQYDDKIFTLEVTPGKDDFIVHAGFQMHLEKRLFRTNNYVNAVFAPDKKTAKALQGAAIYHDGKVFWQGFQVRYHDWLKTVKPEQFVMPADLPVKPDYISVASNHTPEMGHADIIMHSYSAHKSKGALYAALKQMNTGLNRITANDKITSGPLRNMAYEMGAYSFFYQRPAWRILQQTDAPEEAKGPIREFMIAYGDRLAFSRAMARVNGNAYSSLVASFRYVVEATQDPLHKRLFDTYWDRFSNGGFGDRVGLGPSGSIQESFGYDYHYGGYVLKGWKSVNADIADKRLLDAYDRILTFYSYISSSGSPANPWSSRTAYSVSGGAYPGVSSKEPANYEYRWKGHGGPDFTVGVNGHNEFFAARRKTYYAVTYHGRLTPTWMGEGMYGQVGFGGGTLCQLHVPGHGQVLVSNQNGKYGKGMGLDNWRNFRIHSIVGETANGKPMVTANSEHMNARLEGNTVTSSGEVRESSVQTTRSYSFEADAIVCKVAVAESASNKTFKIWAHKPKPREFVTLAYEMIPFYKPPKWPKTKSDVTVTAIDAAGKDLGELTDSPVEVASVVVDRGGYGVRIVLKKPRLVHRGANETVMIQLTSEKSLPGDLGIEYRLEPYVGMSAP